MLGVCSVLAHALGQKSVVSVPQLAPSRVHEQKPNNAKPKERLQLHVHKIPYQQELLPSPKLLQTTQDEYRIHTISVFTVWQ